MKISTKGRYAIRVILDLAEHNTGQYTPLDDIAQRQEISEKYLESIVSILVKNNLLTALRGKGGGYKLMKEPIASILRVTEGSFAPVACLEQQPNRCDRVGFCKTLKMWEGFQQLIEDYFEHITILDLMDGSQGADCYMI